MEWLVTCCVKGSGCWGRLGWMGILCLLLLVGCRKVGDEFDPPCEALPPAPPLDWRDVLVGNYSVLRPCFNPRNQDEIVFVRHLVGGSEDELVKYNLSTKDHQVLFTGAVYGIPSWGSNGWILVGSSDENIYKVKENGDSLTQLTTEGGKFYPKWDPAGERFACMNIGQARVIFYDSRGMPLDSLFHVRIGVSWNHPRYSPWPFDDYVHLADMVADTLIPFVAAPSSDRIWALGAIFTSESRLVVSYASGIYAIDLPSKTVTLLRPSCDAVLYRDPTYSPQRNQLLWSKLSRNPVGNTLYYTTKLVLTTIDGDGEEEVELPF